MRQKIIKILAATIVSGVTATAIAVDNPFADIPEGHWAYRSVAKLASEGVIEGYADGSYRGDRNITRYEMAQMIAKALAKNITGANRAELDRLAIEFRDELDALGFRISNLEEYADKVQWTGELRYRYWNERESTFSGEKLRNSKNQLQFRLFPTVEIDDNWLIRARLTASHDLRADSSGDFDFTYAFAEGIYDKYRIRLGKMPLYSHESNGMILDDFFSGAQFSVNDKIKLILEGGRWNLSNSNAWIRANLINNSLTDYLGAELSYDDFKKIYIGASYRYFKSENLKSLLGYKDNEGNAIIWSVGACYKIADDIKISGAFANNIKANNYGNAYNMEIGYFGADKDNPNSFGAAVAYRNIGDNVGFMPTYDVWEISSNKKGVDIMFNWIPIENTYTQLNYFVGKTLNTDKNTNTLFARISYFF